MSSKAPGRQMIPRAVVSDLGGVFVQVDMSPLREYLARASGLQPEEAWRRVWEASAWARHQPVSLKRAQANSV